MKHLKGVRLRLTLGEEGAEDDPVGGWRVVGVVVDCVSHLQYRQQQHHQQADKHETTHYYHEVKFEKNFAITNGMLNGERCGGM